MRKVSPFVLLRGACLAAGVVIMAFAIAGKDTDLKYMVDGSDALWFVGILLGMVLMLCPLTKLSQQWKQHGPALLGFLAPMSSLCAMILFSMYLIPLVQNLATISQPSVMLAFIMTPVVLGFLFSSMFLFVGARDSSGFVVTFDWRSLILGLGLIVATKVIFLSITGYPIQQVWDMYPWVFHAGACAFMLGLSPTTKAWPLALIRAGSWGSVFLVLSVMAYIFSHYRDLDSDILGQQLGKAVIGVTVGGALVCVGVIAKALQDKRLPGRSAFYLPLSLLFGSEVMIVAVAATV